MEEMMTEEEMVTITVSRKMAEAIKSTPAMIEDIKKDLDAMKKTVIRLQKAIKEITKTKEYRY
jgi:hypothetical protein